MNVPYHYRRAIQTSAFVCVVVAAGLGCSGATQPQEAPGVQEGLRVEVTVTPNVVRPGDSLLVTLRIVNTTAVSIQLGSRDGCVALPVVYADGRRVEWEGTALGCLMMLSTFTVPEGGSLTRQFPLLALLRRQTAPWAYDVPPPPGRYDLVMDMHVELDDVAREIVVAN